MSKIQIEILDMKKNIHLIPLVKWVKNMSAYSFFFCLSIYAYLIIKNTKIKNINININHDELGEF